MPPFCFVLLYHKETCYYFYRVFNPLCYRGFSRLAFLPAPSTRSEIVKMVLIVNWVKDFCGVHCPDRITFALKVSILAYLLSGLFNWPMHLWVPSVFAIVSYSIFILRISEYGNVQKRA